MESSWFQTCCWMATEKITYGLAHIIYPNSEGLKKFILQHLHVPDRKVKIIGKGSSNGIDTVFFSRSVELKKKAKELRYKYKINEGDFVFSFLGRIVRDKGIIELATAFKTMQDTRGQGERRLVLLMVGPFENDLDPLPPSVMEFLMENKDVFLAGFQEDVRPWIMASDVFVFPSYREGFPNVVMQASSAGSAVYCIGYQWLQ